MAMTEIDTKRVRAWMVLQGLTQQDVAAEVGVSRQMVSLFLLGLRGSIKLRDFYAAKGCPERYLPRFNRAN